MQLAPVEDFCLWSIKKRILQFFREYFSHLLRIFWGPMGQPNKNLMIKCSAFHSFII